MDWQAKWIKPQKEMGDVVPVFERRFEIQKKVKTANLFVTAMGIYEARLNGRRISRYVLAPGWTSYKYRLQYQKYDVTEMLGDDNRLSVYVGKGWFRGILNGNRMREQYKRPAALLAQLELEFQDGEKQWITTDENWRASESEIRFSEIYNGEICDAHFSPSGEEAVEIMEDYPGELILQEGEEIVEHEIFPAVQLIHTPKGEQVIDFGQEITGYVEVTLDAEAGDVISLSHGEMLDQQGNFYNENYRAAKAEYRYICKDGKQTFHPRLTFYGFRYVRVDRFPGGIQNAQKENFRAIAVYSDIRQTGFVRCSNPVLNQFFSNVFWGQKDNFLDVPTDCPQRDERLGWLGDAQVFVRSAAFNFDVEKFFNKWLADVRLEQREDGFVPLIVPDLWETEDMSSAWSDAVTICPWELYKAYGNRKILEQNYECMRKYVDYITAHTEVKNLWIGGFHYGDWLGLDAKPGSYEGASRKEIVASAYYAYSTALLVKTGTELGKDMRKYEMLYQNIVKTFQETYPEYRTQTEYAVAIHFRLAKDCQKMSDQLAELILEQGERIQTGFVGTSYLLYALSDFGHADLAYSLLLRTEYPSWLYPVTKGATTIWEHWDGIKENGDFWDAKMNSFNHYSYGSVIEWVYTVAAGIRQAEDSAGYRKVRIVPIPDERLDWLEVSLDTRNGRISSGWRKEGNTWCYLITVPVEAEIEIGGMSCQVKKGSYKFYTDRDGRAECLKKIMG